ncbi:hypothetical protein Tco_0591424 [Tanacetum coccineum]
MASQDARLSKFGADFKQQQGEMTNNIDTFLKAINDRMTGALPSDTVKNLKLNINSTSSVLSARSCLMEDLQCSSHSLNSINAIKTCSKQTSNLQKDQPAYWTTKHNVLDNEQQHTKQSEPIYDTYLLEKVNSNTTPDSTHMSHRRGEIDQDSEQYQVKSPLLNVEFFKMNDMVGK